MTIKEHELEVMKAKIDLMSYAEMLARWRFSPMGDPYFLNETGKYFLERMAVVRKKIGDKKHFTISKSLGWNK